MAEGLSEASQRSNTETTSIDHPSVAEGDEKHKPSGKRVTFPSDEDIVSGAVEPKDPWRHAQNVTLEEILSSYKQACQKLNCKPIPKVLKQIQELKDLTQRNECLDLKGEKLDYKACESLEEILKRVQFKVIDLEQTNLDEDGASALFDMIEYYESATHLNISFNKHIGTRGWQAAAHMMRKTSSLQYLDARNTPLLDHSAPFVARALRISGSLAVLHLENAGLSGRPLMLLATALKMNMNLRELYLADNKLNGLQDSAQLGNLLKFNYNIQILDLRNNHILDSGLAYVCEGLKEQRKGLVTLVLWNNQLTHNGMGYLAAALPCTQSLETLNLGHNAVGNEGVHKLKDGLIANRSVLRLGLASTKLSCEGAVAVAEFIAESPRLLRLDLRENEIKTGGLMALSLALKVNTSLLRLDLDREPKKETVKSFIETQRALLAEIQNGCKRNFILAKEKEETEQKMRLSASMAEIATEDGTRDEEDEEEPASEDRVERKEVEEDEEGESTGNTVQTSSQPGSSSEVSASQINMESDSDTEDEEEEEEVVTKSCATLNSSTHSNQTAPQTESGVAQPALSASHASLSPSASPVGGPSVVSSITVMESPVSPGTPPSPGRCISVSSPGRGHKIFMVTRVESPPEQQLLQIGAPTSPSQTKEASKKPVDMITQPMLQQTPPAPQTPTQTLKEVKESLPAPSTDCKMTEQSPVAHLESALHTKQSHTLEPHSTSQSTDHVTPSTLDPDGTDPSLQVRGPPSDFSPVQPQAWQLRHGACECQLWTGAGGAAARSQFGDGEGSAMRLLETALTGENSTWIICLAVRNIPPSTKAVQYPISLPTFPTTVRGDGVHVSCSEGVWRWEEVEYRGRPLVSVAVMRPLHCCMLAVTLLLLVCEVIFSQLCKSLITLVDGFHTLFVLLCMVTPPPLTATIIKPPLCPLDSPASPSCHSSAPHAESCVVPPPGTQTTTEGPGLPAHPHTNHEASSLVTSYQLSPPGISPPALDCGVSYTNSRVQPVGTFFSTLLLVCLCISYLIEIISFSLEPHPVQRPFLLVAVGAVSLLHKMLLLRLNWNQLRNEREETYGRPESGVEVNHKVLAEEETKNRAESGRGLDEVNQVQSAVDTLLHNGALVLCNPETSSVPDTDSQTPEQQPQVHLCAASPQNIWDSDVVRRGRDLKISQRICYSSNVTGILKDNVCMGHREGQNTCKSSHHREEPATSRWPVGIVSALLVAQGLFTSLLALANSLVMLLIQPQLLHSPGPNSLVVYLDPGLSLLAVIVLITTVWPQMCRYGLLLLQGTPPHICVQQLERRIASVPGVQAVHDLHIWQLAESLIVASVHVHCTARFPAHRCADLMSGVTKVLQSVGVSCCTVQPEFASCGGSSADAGRDDSPAVHRQDRCLPPPLACSLACGKACAGSMCCSPREENTRSLMAPTAGETKAEPQTLIIENAGGK
ncbi:hypothetical protein Q5P01_010267 [Channa striata]|uniref:Protein phosphatase 1 regulatory subunit 37 n=1 Tax=Channa striata TaxID=64152 RepID=A0AA88SQC7_CHASR|nr:hypothetical protein Q5P01_010267 [Channa striata]